MRSPLNLTLDWHEQRRKWNSEGHCAREACENKHGRLVNSGNQLLYCLDCALAISQCGDVHFITVNATPVSLLNPYSDASFFGAVYCNGCQVICCPAIDYDGTDFAQCRREHGHPGPHRFREHGGKREGAGRPRKVDDGVDVTLRLPRWVRDEAAKRGPVAEVLRSIVEKHFEEVGREP